MPVTLYNQIMSVRGLILVVGAAGSGKSTTIASMLDFRNMNDRGHILTIEDPIEYQFTYRNCIIDQREVGVDTKTFESALSNALREAPDVLFIGEIRSYEVMRQVLSYADTGVLVVSTLHSNNADQAIDRILSFYPESAKDQVLLDLSLVLRSIISQRLVVGKNGKLYPVVEILLNTPYVSKLIAQARVRELKDAMIKGQDDGMLTFDQSLYDMYVKNKISKEEALKHADSRTDLKLRMKLTEYQQ